MPFKSLLTCFALFFLMAPLAHAQEEEAAEPATATGMTAEELAAKAAEQAKWDARIARANGYRTKVLQTKQGMRLWWDVQAQYREKIAESRHKCAGEVRRSNRDNIERAKMLCLRREFMLEKEMRTKQSTHLDTLPGVDEDRRAQAQAAIAELIEALDAVMKGIENKVYADRSELLEAKQTLHKSYRQPAMVAVLHAKIDRAVTWVAHVLVRVLNASQNTVVNEAAFAKVEEAIACYDSVEAALLRLLQVNGFKKVNQDYRETIGMVKGCHRLLRDARQMMKEDSETQE